MEKFIRYRFPILPPAVSTGLMLGGGADIAEMKNDNGVIIQLLDSTTEGLGASLAVKGVHISIAE